MHYNRIKNALKIYEVDAKIKVKHISLNFQGIFAV